MERTLKKVGEDIHNPLWNQLSLSSIPGKFLSSLVGKLIRCLGPRTLKDIHRFASAESYNTLKDDMF